MSELDLQRFEEGLAKAQSLVTQTRERVCLLKDHLEIAKSHHDRAIDARATMLSLLIEARRYNAAQVD